MSRQPLYLGVEGGGTRTVAIAADDRLGTVKRAEFGPGNLRLLSPQALAGLLTEIAQAMPEVCAIGIGLAGLRDASDEARVRAAVERIWGVLPLAVTHDLEIALRAAQGRGTGSRVLVLAGTGSCCFGQDATGRTAKVGGWGHLLGDLGSGYDIALRALRAVIYDYDRAQRWGILGSQILRALLLNSPNDLIAWIQSADKRTIAHLAPTVFDAAARGDRAARKVLAEAGAQLAQDALTCGARLAHTREAVSFVFAGSVLRNQPGFVRAIKTSIRRGRPAARFEVLERDGAIGAVKLALETAGRVPCALQLRRRSEGKPVYVPAFDPAHSPTEQRNPKSMNLDRLSFNEGVSVMLDAESEVVPALRARQREIERAVALASAALRQGGRIIYAGAGTSGRLGVLDASECPPTFRAAPELVQGIIAGGQRALWQAVEGAEDDAPAGAQAVRLRKVSSRDVVVGIAASGRTPFVWGALAEARKSGAATVLLCFNPALKIARAQRPDVLIAPDLGPEILTGSTRLKCGTATKLVLNMITTLAMVRLGKVVSNLMVDLNPSNVKLRDRAVRIVRDLTGCTAEEAAAALRAHQWIVKKAWNALRDNPSNA